MSRDDGTRTGPRHSVKRVIGHGYRTAITAAEALLPPQVLDLIRADYLCGVDPVFVGLHRYDHASYGRTYRNTAHVAYPFHQSLSARADRVTTVVLPVVPAVAEVVHELGHVLDERLGFDHTAAPVSWYAETARSEAFAEAFTSWLIPGYARRPDPCTLAVLEQLVDARR